MTPMCHLKMAESHQKSGWMAVAPTFGISDSGMFKLFETLGASALYHLIDSKWLLYAFVIEFLWQKHGRWPLKYAIPRCPHDSPRDSLPLHHGHLKSGFARFDMHVLSWYFLLPVDRFSSHSYWRLTRWSCPENACQNKQTLADLSRHLPARGIAGRWLCKFSWGYLEEPAAIHLWSNMMQNVMSWMASGETCAPNRSEQMLQKSGRCTANYV